MKKILGVVLVSTLLWSCGSQFNHSRYGKYMWNRSSSKSIVEENEVVKNNSKPVEENRKNNGVILEEKSNSNELILANKKQKSNSVNTQSTVKKQSNVAVKTTHSKSELNSFSKIDKKDIPFAKTIQKKFSQKTKKNNPYNAADVDAMWIVTLILCFLIPPLGVYLKDGSLTGLFWLVLILCLLGGGVLFGFAGYFGGLYGVGIVLALLRFFDII